MDVRLVQFFKIPTGYSRYRHFVYRRSKGSHRSTRRIGQCYLEWEIRSLYDKLQERRVAKLRVQHCRKPIHGYSRSLCDYLGGWWGIFPIKVISFLGDTIDRDLCVGFVVIWWVWMGNRMGYGRPFLEQLLYRLWYWQFEGWVCSTISIKIYVYKLYLTNKIW